MVWKMMFIFQRYYSQVPCWSSGPYVVCTWFVRLSLYLPRVHPRMFCFVGPNHVVRFLATHKRSKIVQLPWLPIFWYGTFVYKYGGSSKHQPRAAKADPTGHQTSLLKTAASKGSAKYPQPIPTTFGLREVDGFFQINSFGLPVMLTSSITPSIPWLLWKSTFDADVFFLEKNISPGTEKVNMFKQWKCFSMSSPSDI